MSSLDKKKTSKSLLDYQNDVEQKKAERTARLKTYNTKINDAENKVRRLNAELEKAYASDDEEKYIELTTELSKQKSVLELYKKKLAESEKVVFSGDPETAEVLKGVNDCCTSRLMETYKQIKELMTKANALYENCYDDLEKGQKVLSDWDINISKLHNDGVGFTSQLSAFNKEEFGIMKSICADYHLLKMIGKQ